jgi:hypothetical protein
MDLSRTSELVFDQTYRGFSSSALGAYIDL